MYRKSMREALREAREYRDPVKEDRGFSSQQIKMAYGILNDPRYKQGNYSGAVRAIEKIARGLSNHPDVANALRRANEEVTAVYTDKKTRQVKSKKFKDINTAKDYFRKTGEAAGQINFREELEEKSKYLRYSDLLIQKGRRRYLSIGATNAIMRKKLDHAMKTGDWTDFNKEEVSHEETV